jgi:putative flavoprotein involved in K+ transport
VREQYDTVIIGGGQAGLAMSYYLRDRGREHIILERKRVAERWHSERWDSLAFQFPNWALRLPGFAYKGSQPDAFAHYLEIVSFVEEYARFTNAPVRCDTAVTSLRQQDTGRFQVETKDGVIEASRVVVATGPFQRASVPQVSKALPRDLYQVSAADYHNPRQLPPGAILVVGSGASGCQIAEELYQSGRTVYFSVSRHRRAPRRYRGRDMVVIITGQDGSENRQLPGPTSTPLRGHHRGQRRS